MCDCSLAIYCFIDDLLKASGHKQDVRAQVSDSEVITIALVAMLYFGGNFAKSRLILTGLGLDAPPIESFALESPTASAFGRD